MKNPLFMQKNFLVNFTDTGLNIVKKKVKVPHDAIHANNIN